MEEATVQLVFLKVVLPICCCSARLRLLPHLQVLHDLSELSLIVRSRGLAAACDAALRDEELCRSIEEREHLWAAAELEPAHGWRVLLLESVIHASMADELLDLLRCAIFGMLFEESFDLRTRRRVVEDGADNSSPYEGVAWSKAVSRISFGLCPVVFHRLLNGNGDGGLGIEKDDDEGGRFQGSDIGSHLHDHMGRVLHELLVLFGELVVASFTGEVVFPLLSWIL